MLSRVVWELGIKVKYLYSRCLQANEHVKAINKSLLRLPKKRLLDRKGKWGEKVLRVLWACKTTVKIPIGETLCILAYKRVYPIKIGMLSYRIQHFDPKENEKVLREHLNLLRGERILRNK